MENNLVLYGVDLLELGKAMLAAAAPMLIAVLKEIQPKIKNAIPAPLRWVVWPAVAAAIGGVITALTGVGAAAGIAVGAGAAIGYGVKKVKGTNNS